MYFISVKESKRHRALYILSFKTSLYNFTYIFYPLSAGDDLYDSALCVVLITTKKNDTKLLFYFELGNIILYRSMHFKHFIVIK